MVPDGFNKWCMIASKKCFCVHSFPTVLLIVYPTRLYQKVCFLILRILIVASFSLRHWLHFPTLELLCVVFIGTCCSYAVMRPYRLNSGSNVDILVLASLAILSLTFSIALQKYVYSGTAIMWCTFISSLLLGIPHMVLILSLAKNLPRKVALFTVYKKYGGLKRCVLASRHTLQIQADRYC